jgi:hypothetical protein
MKWMAAGIVLVILLLGTIWLFGTGNVEEDPRDRTEQRLNSIHQWIDLWAKEQGRLPTDQEGLDVVLARANQRPVFDAWQQPVRYRSSAASSSCGFAYSIGQDGRDDGGSGDDVRLAEDVCLETSAR